MKTIKIKIIYQIGKDTIEVEHDFEKSIFDALDINRAVRVSLDGAISELKRKLQSKK